MADKCLHNFGVEAASRACKIAFLIKGQKVDYTFLPEAIQIRPNPGLLPCLVSQLTPLAE